MHYTFTNSRTAMIVEVGDKQRRLHRALDRYRSTVQQDPLVALSSIDLDTARSAAGHIEAGGRFCQLVRAAASWSDLTNATFEELQHAVLRHADGEPATYCLLLAWLDLFAGLRAVDAQNLEG